MCRMLAFASDRQQDAAPYLAALARFSLCGSLVARWERRPGGNHPDGWGVAYRDGSGTHLVRGGLPAAADPAFAKLSVSTDRFIGHVRYASNTATVNAENAHPFRIGGILLAQNGTFKGRIGREAYGRTTSDTLVFLERLAALWTDRTLGGLREVLDGLLSNRAMVGAYSAANLLIASDGSIFALRDFRRHPDYYTLWLRAAEGEAAVASEPLGDASGWRLLEPGELVELCLPQPRSALPAKNASPAR